MLTVSSFGLLGFDMICFFYFSKHAYFVKHNFHHSSIEVLRIGFGWTYYKKAGKWNIFFTEECIYLTNFSMFNKIQNQLLF